ncbi:hydroxymethylglutaryl-CoA lyase [uncultured Phascolarctobacterium sp.]|uniref:hydroxymethylglutaryl-CoA lyase n=1 Tax=Phascolarctobacterium sp. TaxID=2049039 RepID=UPI0025E85B07|nr:hydroxymethylglutaryl-CoA lyase [uncultured Phascolarctobacterium sp.]
MLDMKRLPSEIKICEVGPRDGLQNEEKNLSTEEKVELIELAAEAGAKVIEIGSFVNPKAVPQMADTDAVARKINRKADVEYRALIFNMQGLERAEAAGITKAKVTVSASRSHCLRNMNKTPEEAVASFATIAEYAEAKGIVLSAAISTAFGCSIDGTIPFEQVLSIIFQLRKLGVQEISLSDTTGMANPLQVYTYGSEIVKLFPDISWVFHFHDTRGMGLANVLMGMLAGITTYDACFGGLGGCPFAPGASGNIATEDLVNMCMEMGIGTGYDLNKYIKLGYKVESYIGGRRSSSILKAGLCCDSQKKN